MLSDCSIKRPMAHDSDIRAKNNIVFNKKSQEVFQGPSRMSMMVHVCLDTVSRTNVV